MENERVRNWFITINEGAESFNKVQELIDSLSITRYAYILHDKDSSDNLHYHIVLELKNGKTLQTMTNIFVGAHIENMIDKKRSYKYLLHKLPSASHKYQYSIDELKTNDIEGVKNLINAKLNQNFNPDDYLTYIVLGIDTPAKFVEIFGLEQYGKWYKTYRDMLYERDDPYLKKLLNRRAMEIQEGLVKDFDDEIFDDTEKYTQNQ